MTLVSPNNQEQSKRAQQLVESDRNLSLDYY